MSEDIRGTKAICHFMGGVCWVTARKKLGSLERESGLKVLVYEDGRPMISRSIYAEARLIVAKK